MANRHAWAVRVCALAPVVVVLALAASATGGTTSTYTYKGVVSAAKDRWDTHRFTTVAGANVAVQLNWWSVAANLQVIVFDPDGNEVAASRAGSARPRVLGFVAASGGTYHVGVRA